MIMHFLEQGSIVDFLTETLLAQGAEGCSGKFRLVSIFHQDFQITCFNVPVASANQQLLLFPGI